MQHHGSFEQVQSSGILKFPSVNPHASRDIYSPIIPAITGFGLSLSLGSHLRHPDFLIHALYYLVVPRNVESIHLLLHVHNTTDGIRHLIDAIMDWRVLNYDKPLHTRL